jgi:preprotein translocase subunit SecA
MIRNFFNNFNNKNFNLIIDQVQKINKLEPQYVLLSEKQIKDKIKTLIIEYQKKKSFDSILIEAFALTREASKRTLGLRHFDTQLMAGIVLHNGKIAEMKTGEGKTLAATLPAVLNALSLRGVQLVTVNDYLAKRDKQAMSQLYRFLGLSVGLIQENMSTFERRKNYSADITYVTNSELVFDYLRDNLALSINDIVLPNFNFCIIDEVDSILIDEARTPLIISGEIQGPTEKYIIADEVSKFLTYKLHFNADEKSKNITLTSEGIKQIEKILKITSLYDITDPWFPFIDNALKAKVFYKINTHYIIENESIFIIDESTGRIMSDRRWSDGLHEAIEAKENVVIKKGSEILSSITYQNFFLSYPKFAGMTGTAKTAEDEFEKIYNLSVIALPTSQKMIRIDLTDLIFKDEFTKWKMVVKEVQRLNSIGRPILIGTTSIEKSQIISELLNDLKIKHRLLNARPENIKLESQIIAQAGKKGAITVATNMAGRGTDILLGGNPDFQSRQQIFSFINDLNKNKFYFLFKDDNFLPNILSLKQNSTKFQLVLFARELEIKIILNKILNIFKKYLHENKVFLENHKIFNYLNNNRIECYLVNIIENGYPFFKNSIYIYLKTLFNYFLIKNKKNSEFEKLKLKKLGGLFVIGTEHHDSQRIDNQLRGRAGRQGDPGSSRFFISLDDNLLRIFGGKEIKKIFKQFNLNDDEPLESKFLDKSINNSQKKVEDFYYGMRKRLLDYDEIIHNQRIFIYNKRRSIVSSINLRSQIISFGEDIMFKFTQKLEQIKRKNSKISFEKINKEIAYFLHIPSPFLDFNSLKVLKFNQIKFILFNSFWISFDLREQELEILNPGLMRILEKKVYLSQVDKFWKLHLQKSDIIKETIGWRSYGQFDPLLEYKNEAFNLFVATISEIKYNSIYEILQVNIQFDKKFY